MDAYEHEHDEQEPPVWKVSHTLDQLVRIAKTVATTLLCTDWTLA